MKLASTTIDFGNRTIEVYITEASVWEKDTAKRIYFTVESGKQNPLSKFYLIESGTSRDNKIEVAGCTFGYAYGFCDSHKKRAAAEQAAIELAKQVVALASMA